MAPTIASVAASLLLLGVVFGLLERARPAISGRPLLRRGLPTDVACWFFTRYLPDGRQPSAFGVLNED